MRVVAFALGQSETTSKIIAPIAVAAPLISYKRAIREKE
jgi:hypothetical protein